MVEVRRFTIQSSSIGFKGGAYTSTVSPQHAAIKAARRVWSEWEENKKKNEKKAFIDVVIRETSDHDKSEHTYRTHKTKLSKPKVSTFPSGTVTFNYEYTATPVKTQK
jgi:hypothetical protein